MELADLLGPDAVIANLRAKSKKQALQDLSVAAARLCDIDAPAILEKLLQRERLGTTGVGQGVAIPHAKFDQLDRIFGVFARLESAIDFESIDEQPVDLIFMLIAPEASGAEHLRTLARISRMLRNKHFCDKLRGSRDASALYALLTEPVVASSSSAA